MGGSFSFAFAFSFQNIVVLMNIVLITATLSQDEKPSNSGDAKVWDNETDNVEYSWSIFHLTFAAASM